MPGGIPRYVRIYDAPGTADRYTVVFTNKAMTNGRDRWFMYLGMSADPFSPQGIGQHGESKWQPLDVSNTGWPPAIGRKCHLGTRIPFDALPEDCKRLVAQDYKDLWNINA